LDVRRLKHNVQKMKIEYYTNEFQTNSKLFESLFSSVDEIQQTWKQTPVKWNLLEILCHLYDEEREDFRTRLKSVLDNPENTFPSIDPPGWVITRNYAQQSFKKMLQQFSQERKNSIEWLQSLQNVNWDNAHQYPKIGPMSARYILANWLAHDYLHIKQIFKLKYDYLKHTSNQNLSYAGDW